MALTDNDYFTIIREAMRCGDTDTPLGQAVARLKEPFVLGDGIHWHYEGFIALFSAIRRALAAIDDTISPDLPPFLLSPSTIARIFGLPLEDFNWQGDAEAKLDKILANTELLVEQETIASLREQISSQEDDPSFTVPQVAAQLQISLTKVYLLTESGKLKSYKTGNQVRIKASHIREYQAQHTRQVVDTKRRRSGSFNKSEADRLFGPGWDA